MQMHEIWERFVEVDPLTGCHLWLGALDSDDLYGQLSLLGFRLSAHRVAYELEYGPIPDGLHVLHKCHTPQCVNAGHLYVGTNRQNQDDRLRRRGCEPERLRRDIIDLRPKRQYRKSGKVRAPGRKSLRHGSQYVLTPDQVREIRKSSDMGSVLADRYGVARGTISKIRSRQLWPTLPD